MNDEGVARSIWPSGARMRVSRMARAAWGVKTQLRADGPKLGVVPNDPHFEIAYRLLLQAYNCAAGFESGPWDFAVDIQELRSAGVAACFLRSLVKAGYVEHALDVSGPRSKARAFRAEENVAF